MNLKLKLVSEMRHYRIEGANSISKARELFFKAFPFGFRIAIAMVERDGSYSVLATRTI